MGIWLFGGFDCNREEPLDDIKHSIYSHITHPLSSHRTSQHNAVNQFISICISKQQHNRLTAFTISVEGNKYHYQ